MRQFYGRLETCALSAGKAHVHKIPRFRGGGGLGFGGGSADFIFMGARIFLINAYPNLASIIAYCRPFARLVEGEFGSILLEGT